MIVMIVTNMIAVTFWSLLLVESCSFYVYIKQLKS